MVKVFISYSWDDEPHKQWVRDFAVRLCSDGIEVTLDLWHAVPGDQLAVFMERAVRESDYVLCICTPLYKYKSDLRNGGVGYEGDVMTGEVFVNHNQRKFIPVLRGDEWEKSAPSWLAGKYFIDLHGNPYSEQNYQDLLSTLLGRRAAPPPIGGNQTQPTVIPGEKFEFVNRDIELATLDPATLQNSYWQCALISAPAGYGKSRLLNRLVEKIKDSPQLSDQWNWRYINMAESVTSSNAIKYFWEKICREKFTSDRDEETTRKQVCNYILENLSTHKEKKSPCGVLLLIDSVDNLTPSNEEWFFPVFHEVVTGSYIDYDKGLVSFPVRLILAGRRVEAFWSRYKLWENSSGRKYHLRSENVLALSPFKKTHVEELIDRRARNAGILNGQLNTDHIAEKLLYFSGGHPAVINGILDELIGRRFRQVDDYLGANFERLIGNHITGVVEQIFEKYDPPSQRDIKTILVFRMVTLDILEKLRSGALIFWKEDNARLLGFLRDNQFLHFDDRMLCYHDDILRRIIYLDFSLGSQEQRGHIQVAHKCAAEYYQALIEKGEQKSLYFIEWLFHALQIADTSRGEILSKWNLLLSSIRPASVLPEDLKKSIWEGLQKDAEIKYIYRESFGVDDFSPLFQN